MTVSLKEHLCWIGTFHEFQKKLAYRSLHTEVVCVGGGALQNPHAPNECVVYMHARAHIGPRVSASAHATCVIAKEGVTFLVVCLSASALSSVCGDVNFIEEKSLGACHLSQVGIAFGPILLGMVFHHCAAGWRVADFSAKAAMKHI